MATADDVFDLAAAVYGEARGEARKGRVAVAHTVVNRARAAGLDVGSVVYGSDQYTALSPRDPNRAKIEKAAKRNDKDWQEAVRVASDVLSGRVPDPTQGATHYHTKSVSPSWGKKLAADGKKVASIGVHTFYSDPVDARRTVQAAARNPVAPIARTPAMLASVPVVGAPAVRADRRLADRSPHRTSDPAIRPQRPGALRTGRLHRPWSSEHPARALTGAAPQGS